MDAVSTFGNTWTWVSPELSRARAMYPLLYRTILHHDGTYNGGDECRELECMVGWREGTNGI